MEENIKNNGLSNLKPKTAFKVGLLSGLGIAFVIGFFVLLGILLAGKFGEKKPIDNNNVAAGNENQETGIQIQAFNEKTDWYRGNKDAKVSIVQFSDLDCPYCSRWHDTTKQIMETYGDKIRLIYRHFPLPSLHPEATKKAQAVECVGEQGGNSKVWEFLDKLFADKPTLAQLPDVVANLGLDKNKFQSCLDSDKYATLIQNESQQAQAAGAQGTPYSVIVTGEDKIAIPGALPFDTVKTQLDNLLK